MWGSHLIKHWSTTRPAVALSSGKAELASIVKGASRSLGFQALAGDMGIRLPLHILSDATAAIGNCRRRGLGKVRPPCFGLVDPRATEDGRVFLIKNKWRR